MKSLFFEKNYIFVIALALLAQACYQSPQAGTIVPADACPTRSCSSSNECGLGEVCGATGCCETWAPEAGTCDELDPTCMTSAKLCATHPGGCECQILDIFGLNAAAGETTIVVTPYQDVPVVAQLALVGADPIVDSDYTLTSSDDTCANVSGGVITTSDQPCEATITVEFGKLATCTAEVSGLGLTNTSDEAILYIVDTESRQPVAAEAIIIDTDGDGLRDIPALATEQTGVYTVALAEPTRADISVFVSNYHYVTLAAIELNPNGQLYVPVNQVLAAEHVGGASGKLNLETHRELVLEGESRSIQLAMVSSALNLSKLPNFDLETLLGGSPAQLDCTYTPNAAGCYDIGIEGVYEATLPVWGGLVFSFQDELMKPHFEVQAEPGRPYLWGLGGEWKLDQVESVARAFLLDESCSASGIQDPECIRKATRSLLKNLSPLMSKASLGVRGNLGLPGQGEESWYEHIETPYGPERLNDTHYPVLDPTFGSHQPLSLNQPLSHYTNIVLPTLPATPTGDYMDTVVAITGVDSRTGGFVPLGLTAGFDCATDDCSDAPGSLGDGIIDGQQLCNPEEEASSELCRDGVPTRQPAGTIGMFHTSPAGYLENEPQRTLVLAMRLDGLKPSTISGLLLDGELPPHSLSLEGSNFMEFEPADIRVDQRLVEFVAHNPQEASQVVIEQAESSLTWTVIASGDTTRVVLPIPPNMETDPLEASSKIISTKLKLRPTSSVQDHVEDFVSGLDRIFDDVVAFSTTHR